MEDFYDDGCVDISLSLTRRELLVLNDAIYLYRNYMVRCDDLVFNNRILFKNTDCTDFCSNEYTAGSLQKKLKKEIDELCCIVKEQ